MSSEPSTLLAGVLRASADDEGGLRALATAIGISRQRLYDVIGGRTPGRHVQRAIASYLEVTVEQIATWARESGA